MSKKVLIIIIIVSFAFMGVMGGGFFILWNKISASDIQQDAKSQEESEQEATAQAIGPIFNLDSFIINTSDPGGNRYLRVTMDLELSTVELTKELQTRLPQIKNEILMILPTRKCDELTSIEGKIALRDELIGKINSLLKTGSITNLYFTEFVIQ